MPCILVADDSRDFAEMLRATLEEAGYEVVPADFRTGGNCRR
jgi:CheY-like chemotaxis protein